MQQHQRQQRRRLGLVGHQLDAARAPSRIASAHSSRADQRVAAGGRVALVEDQVERRQHRARGARAARSRPGTSYGMPRVADLALRAHEPLRHRRLGDEERARDLGRVSPPSVRSVSATRASGASAGWQQVKISRSRSSGIALASSASGVLAPRRRAPRAPRARPLVLAASARGAAGRSPCCGRRVVIQAPGLSGTPSLGPALERDDERLLDRLLGEVEVAEDADQGGDRPPRLVPEQAVDDARDCAVYDARLRARPGSSEPDAVVVHHRADLDRRRPGAGIFAAHSSASSRSVALEQVEAAELLLGLRERAVGDDALAVRAIRTVVAVRARLQALAGDEARRRRASSYV